MILRHLDLFSDTRILRAIYTTTPYAKENTIS